MLVFGFPNYYIWVSKIYFEKEFSFTKVVNRLSHAQVALFNTFRGVVQSCEIRSINHAASRIKQVQLQNCSRITPTNMTIKPTQI